ncbi:DNA-binding response regulator [Salipiger bermudensis HTCC2601]|uniref:DNA-binding response regulator n=1 Tax=Salipiger bermudensis (strain DSM 26914 / JCM 13377 / KCTC 12554 / HTCC2601) TaxID=314265 RepID=Q0FL05_SALBH|nr:DNA-binding response regulator [Salipiger bermudensis HTCC2601]
MAQIKNILLVDDDDDLREALAEQLVMTEDFEVFEAETAAAAMGRVKVQNYELIILDVGLPDNDGRELCRLMRKQGVKAPIIMLTGHDTDADTILGLDAGANDYVTKPFSSRFFSPGSAPSCASTSNPRTRSSPSAPTRSSRR